MMFWVPGRVILLALLLFFFTGKTGIGFAHSLPGSTLTFSQTDGQIQLSITLPLEDLILASPVLKALEDTPSDQDVPAKCTELLSTYFTDHLILQHTTADLPLTLVRASVQTDRNEQAGAFKALIIQFNAPLPESGNVFPLTLTYDAIMHEVRNHRATVYWAQPGTNLNRLAEFGFQTVDGKLRPVLLRKPQDQNPFYKTVPSR